MNKRLWLLCIFGIAVAAASMALSTDAPAPDFTGIDSKGRVVRLSDLQGQVVVLEWTNHDCPYVRKHYGTGNMQQLQGEWTDRGVIWVSVISSAPGKQGHVDGGEADRLSEERGASPTYVVLDADGEIGRLYGATNTPHMYIIDTDGTLVYQGAIDDQPSSRWDSVDGADNYVDMALEDVFAGRPVGTPTTRAYGCSVKY